MSSTCEDCFEDILRFGVRNNSLVSSSWGVTCPVAGCGAVDTWETVGRVTGGDDRQMQRMLHQRLKSMPGFRWCREPGCSFGAVVEPGACQQLVCPVCAERCSWCRGPAHASCPVRASHERAAMWNRVRIMFKSGIRACPSCRSFIEKNEGCQHMTCKSCNHEFCWECKANWKPGHVCRAGARVVLRKIVGFGIAVVQSAVWTVTVVAIAATGTGYAGMVYTQLAREKTLFEMWACKVQQIWRKF